MKTVLTKKPRRATPKIVAQLRNTLRSRNGTTLVTVIVAVVLLTAMVAMFSQTVDVALNLVDLSNNENIISGQILENYYTDSGVTVTGTQGSVTLTLTDTTAAAGVSLFTDYSPRETLTLCSINESGRSMWYVKYYAAP